MILIKKNINLPRRVWAVLVKQLIRPMVTHRSDFDILHWCGSTQGSLVQRELSAKLTEGLFYRSIDMLTHASKVPADFIVRNTNDCQSITSQKSSAFCIFLYITVLAVLRTIQFYYQLGFRTVKICNVFPQHLLSGKANRIGTQKVIPKMAFFLCHFLSTLFCQWNQPLIILRLHYNLSVTASPCHLPLHKGGFGALQNRTPHDTPDRSV